MRKFLYLLGSWTGYLGLCLIAIVVGNWLLFDCSNSFYQYLGMVILTIAGTFMMLGFVVVLIKYLNRSFWQNFIFVAILCFGIVVYSEYVFKTEDFWGVLLAGCHALAGFFPSRGGYEKEIFDENIIIYTVFHTAVYLFFAYFAMIMWGQRAINRLHNCMIKNKNKYVFWCKQINDNLLYLAKDISMHNFRAGIIISIDELENHETKTFWFREMNFLNYVLKIRKPKQIHSDCLSAPQQFFLSDDHEWNIRYSLLLLKIRRDKKISSPLHLYIKIDDSATIDYYEKWADMILGSQFNSNKIFENVEIHLINESELIANELLKKYPMLKCPGITIVPEKGKVKGSFKVLLIGFGKHGTEILKKTIIDSQFLQDSPLDKAVDFSIDILDKDLQRIKTFFAKFADLKNYCKMNFDNIEKYQMDAFSAEFYNFLEQNLEKYNRIFVCLGDDKLNLEVSALIEKIAKLNRISDISAKLFTIVQYNTAIMEQLNGKVAVNIIGKMEDIYNYDTIIDENFQIRAKLVHLAYEAKDFDLKKQMKNGVLIWADNTFYDRRSSLSSAMGLRNFVLLLSPEFSAEEAERIIPDNYAVKYKALEKTLKKTEHLRWMAFIYCEGIKCWKLSEITEELLQLTRYKANAIKQLGKHAALVDWDMLPEVEQKCTASIDLQELDGKIIVKLPIIYKTAQEYENYKNRYRKRKLFCEISPFCYEISVIKCCILRHLRDLFCRESFCCKQSDELLPTIIYKHKSLIRRKLGNVDMTLQENKAINLSLAVPRISKVLIQPGETFSLWHLLGKTSARKGYKEGLLIKQGNLDRGIGGGLCQLSNLIHWVILHTPFEITEYHHHDGVDLFPDFGRRVPFGVGTSISYNYLDYRFRNTTEQTFQLIMYTDEKYLNAELRAEKSLSVKYHIKSRNERFTQENGDWYRNGEVYQRCIDKVTGKTLEDKLIKINHAKVMYDEKYIDKKYINVDYD